MTHLGAKPRRGGPDAGRCRTIPEARLRVLRQSVVHQLPRQRFKRRAELGRALDGGDKPFAATHEPAPSRLLVEPFRQRHPQPPGREVLRLFGRIGGHFSIRRALQIGPQRRMTLQKRPAGRRQQRNLHPLPERIPIQEHAQDNHLVRRGHFRRLEHAEPSIEAIDNFCLACVEIHFSLAESKPAPVRRRHRQRQITRAEKLRRRRPPPEIGSNAAIRLLHRRPPRGQEPPEKLLRLEFHIENAALRQDRFAPIEESPQQGEAGCIGRPFDTRHERQQMDKPAREHAVIAHEVDHLEPCLPLRSAEAAAELLQEDDLRFRRPEHHHPVHGRDVDALVEEVDHAERRKLPFAERGERPHPRIAPLP